MTEDTRKEREFARREKEILDALLECMDNQPFDHITVESIANHIGIAKGTIYKHVSCKEDLIAKLNLRFLDELINLFASIDQPSLPRSVSRISLPPPFNFSAHRLRTTFRTVAKSTITLILQLSKAACRPISSSSA